MSGGEIAYLAMVVIATAAFMVTLWCVNAKTGGRD